MWSTRRKGIEVLYQRTKKKGNMRVDQKENGGKEHQGRRNLARWKEIGNPRGTLKGLQVWQEKKE